MTERKSTSDIFSVYRGQPNCFIASQSGTQLKKHGMPSGRVSAEHNSKKYNRRVSFGRRLLSVGTPKVMYSTMSLLGYFGARRTEDASIGAGTAPLTSFFTAHGVSGIRC